MSEVLFATMAQGRAQPQQEIVIGPKRYSEIVGQDDLIRRLKTFAAFHLKNESAAGHVLIIGEEGTGRATIAKVFANELGLSRQEIDTSKLHILGDLSTVFTNICSNEILIFREIHRLKRTLLESFTRILRTQQLVINVGERQHILDIPVFTLVGTATKKSDCAPDLLDCFSLVVSLQPYSKDTLGQISERIASYANVELDPESAKLIASNCGGHPSQVEVLLQRITKAVKKQRITIDDMLQVFSAFGLSVRDSASVDDYAGITNISGVEFEKLVTVLLARMGFRAEMTKATGDGGVDIVAVLDKPIIGGRYLFQCKRYGPSNLIGVSIVRDFYGAVTADKAVKGIIVTTSDFTPQAREFAERVGLELINLTQLQQLLSEFKESS